MVPSDPLPSMAHRPIASRAVGIVGPDEVAITVERLPESLFVVCYLLTNRKFNPPFFSVVNFIPAPLSGQSCGCSVKSLLSAAFFDSRIGCKQPCSTPLTRFARAQSAPVRAVARAPASPDA